MSMNRNVTLFLSAVLSSALLVARPVVVLPASHKVLEFFFSFTFPFSILLDAGMRCLSLPLASIIILILVVAIESYTLHRFLKRPCIFVVPRMIFVNMVELVVLFLMMHGFGLLYRLLDLVVFDTPFGSLDAYGFIPNIMGRGVFDYWQQGFWLAAPFWFVCALILFYVRFKTACKMFSWFDSSIDRGQLKKAMLLANGLSYAFLFMISVL